MKRFGYVRGETQGYKLLQPVSAPSIVTLPSGSAFTLKSVVHHIGDSIANGHYTMSMYNKEDDSLILVDDRNISSNIYNEEEKSNLNYMFVYDKM